MILGAYGLIGSACVHAALNAGHRVTAVGRSAKQLKRLPSAVRCLPRDITQNSVDDWRQDLHDVDVVVNATGALQDGFRDQLKAIHEDSVVSLLAGMAGGRIRLIHVSAAGVSPQASTAFFRTKANGDASIMASDVDWVIVRPTIVLSPQAYGGTALLRAAAAMPWLGIHALPEARLQTVFVDDLANAIMHGVEGVIPTQTVMPLTESDSHSLKDTTTAIRRWLGFPAWPQQINLPAWMLTPISMVADGLGWLGWRSPLRRTALRVLRDGVEADPAPWQALTGKPCRTLEQSLQSMPSTQQERWFARMYLLLPIIMATLSVFWLFSGVVGLLRFDEACTILTEHDFSQTMATFLVAGGSIADIILGLMVWHRHTARTACLGMILLSLSYLVAASVFVPALWLHPLGVLAKVLPGLLLAGVAWVLLEER